MSVVSPTGWRWARRPPRPGPAGPDDAGVMTAEFLIAGAFFLMAFFGLCELAIWAHTRTVVQAAAMEAVTAANGAPAGGGVPTGAGSTAAAEQAAREYIGDAATIDEVTVTRDQQWVRATITISKPNWLVPGLHLSGHAQQATERYVPPNG